MLRTGIPSVVAHQQWAEEPVRRKAPTDRPGQAPAAPAGTSPRKSRRRASLAELTVVALGLSIVLACLFVGYAIVYRMQMSVGIEVAAAPPRTLSATAPTGATLVPTFTATPSPGALSGPGMTATALPTPVPEAAAPKPAAPEPTPVVRPRAESPPTRLVIPKIDVDIPVLPVAVRVATIAGQERAIWSDVPRAGAFHETSAYPGNPGNTVINGHRDILGSVFRHLDRLEAGDQILVYVGDQVYPYFVTERLVVPDTFASAAQRAENAKLIGYFPEERLTLITCTPLGLATHRLVVVAKPLARLAPRSPEADWHSGP